MSKDYIVVITGEKHHGVVLTTDGATGMKEAIHDAIDDFFRTSPTPLQPRYTLSVKTYWKGDD